MHYIFAEEDQEMVNEFKKACLSTASFTQQQVDQFIYNNDVTLLAIVPEKFYPLCYNLACWVNGIYNDHFICSPKKGISILHVSDADTVFVIDKSGIIATIKKLDGQLTLERVKPIKGNLYDRIEDIIIAVNKKHNSLSAQISF